jgi:hypothetical protein
MNGKKQTKEETMNVILNSNIYDFSADDFEMTEEEFTEIKDHYGHTGEAELAVDQGEFEFNYYIVTFEDGFVIENIGGYCLEEV